MTHEEKEQRINQAFRSMVDAPMWDVTYRKEGHLWTCNVRAASAEDANIIMEYIDLDVVSIEPLRLH